MRCPVYHNRALITNLLASSCKMAHAKGDGKTDTKRNNILMSYQLLWYMLAAFIVGFALSTLWEWFYFRAARVQWRDGRLRDLEAELNARNTELALLKGNVQEVVSPATYASVATTTVSREYQSNAARLDSERHDFEEEEIITATAPQSSAPVPNEPAATQEAESEYAEYEMREELEDAEDEFYEASTPFEPEEEQVRFERSAREPVERRVETRFIRREAAPPEHATPPPRTVAATPQTHEDLARLIARLEALEQQSAERTERMASALVASESAPPRERQPAAPEEEPLPADANEFERSGDEAAIEPASAEPSRPTRGAPAFRANPVQRSSRMDNLQAIGGIGKIYEDRLHEQGIYTWRQIAESDAQTLRTVTRARPGIDVTNWISQAVDLMREYGQADVDVPGQPSSAPRT